MQEPWGFTPNEVSRLTPWQVARLYLRPAAERADEQEHKAGGGSAGTNWAKGLPPKAAFVADHAARFGGPAAKWEAAWDRMKAAEDADRAAARTE
jgi:hypothetical protein